MSALKKKKTHAVRESLEQGSYGLLGVWGRGRKVLSETVDLDDA